MVSREEHDKIRGRVAILMATLKAEQVVTKERAKQVDEVRNKIELGVGCIFSRRQTKLR